LENQSKKRETNVEKRTSDAGTTLQQLGGKRVGNGVNNERTGAIGRFAEKGSTVGFGSKLAGKKENAGKVHP